MAKAIAYLIVGVVLLVFFFAMALVLAGVRKSSVRFWLRKNYLKRRSEFSASQLMEEAYIPADVLSGERLLALGCLPGILGAIVMIIGAQSDTKFLAYVGAAFFLVFVLPIFVYAGFTTNETSRTKEEKEFYERRRRALNIIEPAIEADGENVTTASLYRRYWRSSFNLEDIKRQKIRKKKIDLKQIANIEDDILFIEKNAGPDEFLKSNILLMRKKFDKEKGSIQQSERRS